MKKTLLIGAALLGLSIGANAQFKIHSNGYLSFLTTSTPLSPISINYAGDSLYLFSAQTSKSGIYYKCTGTGSTSTQHGVRFNVQAGSAQHYSIGLRTQASGGTMGSFGVYAQSSNSAGRAISVLGRLETCSKGAAIYGTTNGNLGNIIPSGSKYAGFFDGDAMVTGDFSVSGSIQGVLLGQSSNIPAGSIASETMGNRSVSVLEKMSSLSATTFQNERPDQDQSRTVQNLPLKDDDLEESDSVETNVIEELFYSKNHYALSADALETVFPDLVYQKKDGSKAINYVEMVPLLVQSINELNARIAELEGADDNSAMKSRAGSKDTSSVKNVKTPASAGLKQNTPNPFSERTEIRFSVPDDVQSAYIYIFDMSGKMLRQIPVDASMQRVIINGYELSAGIYLYSLVINGQEIDTKRMILSK